MDCTENRRGKQNGECNYAELGQFTNMKILLVKSRTICSRVANMSRHKRQNLC